jgi:hypothetical protein
MHGRTSAPSRSQALARMKPMASKLNAIRARWSPGRIDCTVKMTADEPYQRHQHEIRKDAA